MVSLDTFEEKNADGDTPLHIAINCGHNMMAKSLIEMGVDLETVDSSHRTPLMNACKKGNKTIAEELISKGCNISFKNAIGDSCMTMA